MTEPTTPGPAAGRRHFPPPLSISPEAREALLRPWPDQTGFPPPDDKAAWLDFVRACNDQYGSLWPAALLDESADAAPDTIGDVPVVRATPKATELSDDRVYLDMHGGALIFLGGDHLRPLAQMTAIATQANVVSIDYRMPPAHPFPAGLDDCVAVYRELLRDKGPANIIVGGASAGGNLALALLLRARDEGLALPAGLVLLSPEADLTESGDTFQTLDGIDRLSSLMPVNRLYADRAPLDHPHVSPLFGDYADFPPTLIQSGTRDLFLSNAVRVHRKMRKAGVAAELHVWEALPHGKFFSAPEDQEIDVEIRAFLQQCWRKSA